MIPPEQRAVYEADMAEVRCLVLGWKELSREASPAACMMAISDILAMEILASGVPGDKIDFIISKLLARVRTKIVEMATTLSAEERAQLGPETLERLDRLADDMRRAAI